MKTIKGLALSTGSIIVVIFIFASAADYYGTPQYWWIPHRAIGQLIAICAVVFAVTFPISIVHILIKKFTN